MLEWDDVDHYREIDSRNPRARWLLDDLDAARRLRPALGPAALPQTTLRGAYAGAEVFTKRLVFSGWAVAPKAVAGLVSLRVRATAPPRRDDVLGPPTGQPAGSPCRHSRGSASERFTTLALLLPCRRLAELGDPLRAARSSGASLPLDVVDASSRVVRGSLSAELLDLVAGAPTSGRSLNIWYAAAQAHLDPSLLDLRATDWRDEERESRGLLDHLEALRDGMQDPAEWGPPPEDLAERLADIAISGPAVAALRSLDADRPAMGTEGGDRSIQAGAARIGWAFQSFFNGPETTSLVAPEGRAGDYWRRVLDHCRDGALGSVLDEWLHLVPDQLRIDANSTEPVADVVDSVSRVLRLKDGSMSTDYFDVDDDGGGPRVEELRTHFAMRFGQARGQTAEGDNPVDVRRAFNSPFRPFVLISTSVGQEGLDFHHYAHAVVHWNLPGNPVDLEQREGRVHRYKNHAVRKNLARRVR